MRQRLSYRFAILLAVLLPALALCCLAALCLGSTTFGPAEVLHALWGDGDPMTLKNLQKGLVDVTVVQQPYEEGRIATKLLFLINREGFKKAMQDIKPMVDKLGMKMDGNIIDTGVQVITPANANQFMQKLHALGLTTT